MGQSNANLHKAKKAKNDEFYTRYVDIEKEMEHYKDKLKGLWVYCPCDAEWSNFWKYFLDNYERLGLKHLTATHIEMDGSRSERLDYDGAIGVPITFLDKWDGEGFEVVGFCNNVLFMGDCECYSIVDGKPTFGRILIRRKR